MQHRMKTHPLTTEQTNKVLSCSQVGSIATLNSDGSPYVTPVHFVSRNGFIYFHGLPKGQKIDNIKNDPRVSMTIYEMDSLLLAPDKNPCDTNTKYQSVILSGVASLVEDFESKKSILLQIVKKYTPQIATNNIPDNMIKGTAVVQIKISEMTGKYYD